MVLAFILGRAKTSLKANLKTVRQQNQANLLGQMIVGMLVSWLILNSKERVKFSIQMVFRKVRARSILANMLVLQLFTIAVVTKLALESLILVTGLEK